MSELPLLERALRDAADRRYGRPWWRPAMRRPPRPVVLSALAAAIAFVGVTILSGSGPAGTDERPATPPAERWTATVNERRGFEVSLPPGWALSEESLTPRLLDPRERLSAGTFPLRHRESDCSHMPAGALRTMGPGDGFVSIQERGRGRGAGFPPRPSSFAARARPEVTDLALCLDAKPRPIAYWLPFSDAGRRFYALLVLGRDAPASIRAEAFAILDRIRFDPKVRPNWDSSP